MQPSIPTTPSVDGNGNGNRANAPGPTPLPPIVVLAYSPDVLSTVESFARSGAIVLLLPHAAAMPLTDSTEITRSAPPPTAGPDAGVGVVLDRRRRYATLDNTVVELTDLEFRLLDALMAEPGRALSFAELRHAVWRDGYIPGDPHAIRSLIQRLRRKFAEIEGEAGIRAVRGYGYRFRPSDGDDEATTDR